MLTHFVWLAAVLFLMAASVYGWSYKPRWFWGHPYVLTVAYLVTATFRVGTAHIQVFEGLVRFGTLSSGM